jgi:hypothetical protein
VCDIACHSDSAAVAASTARSMSLSVPRWNVPSVSPFAGLWLWNVSAPSPSIHSPST